MEEEAKNQGKESEFKESTGFESPVTRRTTLKALGAGSAGFTGLATVSRRVAAADFTLDFTIYTGDTMSSLAQELNQDTFGPASWVEDYFNTDWPNVSNISGTSSTVSIDVVPDGNFDDSSCSNFLSDFNSWLDGHSDRSTDTNVLLTNVSSVSCGGMAYGGCTRDDGADAAVAFECGAMYNTYEDSVQSTYEFDKDEDGSWTSIDDAYYKLSTSFMEGGHNLGLGHKHGNANDASLDEFTPMVGGYADPSGSSCCGQNNWCGTYIDCIDIYDSNCQVDYRLANCTQSEGAYPGYPYCSNDGKDSCPGGYALDEDGDWLMLSVPIPHSGEEAIRMPTPDQEGSRTLRDAQKRQEERGKFASDIIIPEV
jgi:hypothetical protein